MKVIYNMEPREEALSKDPQMDLAATILFIEATEAGNDRLVSCLEALQPAVGPTIQFWWQKTTNKALPEVNAADTVEETDTGDLPMEIPRRKIVLIGPKNFQLQQKGTFSEMLPEQKGGKQSPCRAESHRKRLSKMTAGLANAKKKSRRDIKHAKVAKWVIETLARNMKPIQHKVYNVN